MKMQNTNISMVSTILSEFLLLGRRLFTKCKFQHYGKNKKKMRSFNWIIKEVIYTHLCYTSPSFILNFNLPSKLFDWCQWYKSQISGWFSFSENKQLSHTSVLIISVSVSNKHEIILWRIAAVKSKSDWSTILETLPIRKFKIEYQLKLVQML